jgi:predicted metalloprotease with PDZ domain
MHRYLSVPFALLCGFVSVLGASNANVRVSVSAPGQITVEAELSSPMRSWSFRDAYAGVLGIAERVEDFRAENVTARKIAPGEFRADGDETRISYHVRLSEPSAAEVSHISWLVGDRGFLMFADLFPSDIDTVHAQFVLPAGWTVESAITADANGEYEVTEPEKAVFFIGRSLRKTTKNVNGMTLDGVLSGDWPFKDGDVLQAATPVMKRYLALTGFRLPQKSAIMIAPLPVAIGSVKWRAETRGSTVVLLIDPNAAFKNWRGQLGVIFTHELLHLWVPNSLKLRGDYDWFFEGFTLYTALRTALELKIISFKEFLDTLARVYDSYLSYSDDLSLIEASERRWTSSGSLVYDKGMLVAFWYDLLIRKESSGKTALADRYRDLFGRRFADGMDGNDVIISVLALSPASRDFAKSYIENSKRLELEQMLPAFGLSLDLSGKSSQLRVKPDLDAEQKRLLHSLGYTH